MKLFYALIIFFFLNNCSFDDKSGIWTNEKTSNENNKLFKEFKEISISENIFNEKIDLKENIYFKLSDPINNTQWEDYFYNSFNNLKNFAYDNNNQLLLKSRKLSRHQVNEFLLVKNNNLIINDSKGNIIIFSINDNKVVSKFNFYKKKYKKIEKKLSLIVEKNIIYVSDNIGYLYAYNYEENRVIWAKNYKSSFRSNIKILGNKIIVSNEKNDLIFFDKNSGNIIKKIPTEETILNNDFQNNISSNNADAILFLNAYGTLYSINSNLLNINWFINLNSSTELTANNLFSGVEIVSNKDKIVVSSTNKTYIINSKNGFIESKFNFSSLIKPIINSNYVFFITKNNLLITFDLEKNQIMYSYNINDKIADFLNQNKKNAFIFSFMLINNDIKVFLKNSFVLNFEISGKLKEIYKLPNKIYSQPILIDRSILYLDKKNKLIIMN